jgi:hypothetical protein
LSCRTATSKDNEEVTRLKTPKASAMMLCTCSDDSETDIMYVESWDLVLGGVVKK